MSDVEGSGAARNAMCVCRVGAWATERPWLALVERHTQRCSDVWRRNREDAERAWDEGFSRGFYDALAGDPARDAGESTAMNPYRLDAGVQ